MNSLPGVLPSRLQVDASAQGRWCAGGGTVNQMRRALGSGDPAAAAPASRPPPAAPGLRPLQLSSSLTGEATCRQREQGDQAGRQGRAAERSTTRLGRAHAVPPSRSARRDPRPEAPEGE